MGPEPELLTPHAWPEPLPAPPTDPLAPPLLVLVDRRLPACRSGLPTPEALLSGAERQRWQQLRQPDDRDRFLLAHAVLRLLLGRWLEVEPASLSFRPGPHGKPQLQGAAASRGLALPFNLSHSGALILLGFHGCRAVGVDLEQLRPGLRWQPVARRCLPPARLAAIEALPEPEQPGGFLQAWCLLEAELKARGEGLFSAGKGRPAGSPDGAAPAAAWRLQLPADYRGAAALA